MPRHGRVEDLLDGHDQPHLDSHAQGRPGSARLRAHPLAVPLAHALELTVRRAPHDGQRRAALHDQLGNEVHASRRSLHARLDSWEAACCREHGGGGLTSQIEIHVNPIE
eukprot:scaffold22641_cov42-Phaeocystis_antarctica.AAC.3